MRFSWNSERFEIKWTFGCGIDSSWYMRKFSKWQDKKILVKYFISDHQKIRFWKWVTIDSNTKMVKKVKMTVTMKLAVMYLHFCGLIWTVRGIERFKRLKTKGRGKITGQKAISARSLKIDGPWKWTVVNFEIGRAEGQN